MFDLFGSNAQSDALGAAIKFQKQQAAKTWGYIDKLDARNAPFLEAEQARAKMGEEFLPQLKDYVEHPTMSPGFQTALKTGLDTLRGEYSTTGSPSSGPAQVAGAKFTENTTNDELQRFRDNLFAVSGFRGANAGSGATPLVGTAAQQGGNIADLMAQRGAVEGAGNAALTGTLSQIPSLFSSIFGMGGPFGQGGFWGKAA